MLFWGKNVETCQMRYPRGRKMSFESKNVCLCCSGIKAVAHGECRTLEGGKRVVKKRRVLMLFCVNFDKIWEGATKVPFSRRFLSATQRETGNSRHLGPCGILYT